MTRRRRDVVAFGEVESAAGRVVGQLASPTFADGDLRGPPAGPSAQGDRPLDKDRVAVGDGADVTVTI